MQIQVLCKWWWPDVRDSCLEWIVKQGHSVFSLSCTTRRVLFFSWMISLCGHFLVCTVITNPVHISKVDFNFHPLMQNQYNLARAQQSYKSLVQIHEKNGECVCLQFHTECIIDLVYWNQIPAMHQSWGKLVLGLLFVFQTGTTLHACNPHLYFHFNILLYIEFI